MSSAPIAPAYRQLGAAFFSEVEPTPLASPRMLAWNGALAEELGLVPQGDDAAAIFAGNQPLIAQTPIATVYSGHQFGVWAGQLGDGRAILLAEIGGQEVQLKGAGPTPYSRRADGRAVLRSSIREYLCSEAMHGLGIPTTRALALVGSPEPVWRETQETAAVVTRVAPSFLRFGHFEHFFYGDDHASLRRLCDFAISRYFPSCQSAAEPVQAMLEEVIARTASLIARWQAVGFCHGVMNSDNMSLLGLTLDYGPFGFLDGFDGGHICNHSDHSGRYAYGNQPQIGLFNLHCLAQALLPLLDRDAAVAALKGYQPLFEAELSEQFSAKLGLASRETEDWDLLIRLFDLLQAGRTDWTIFWRQLSAFDTNEGAANTAIRDLLIDRDAFDAWTRDYRARLLREGSVDQARHIAMQAVNPKYILRQHLAEQAIRQAQQGDYAVLERLREILSRPFDEQMESDEYAQLPPDWAAGLSVSCSS
ncbi:YdiU family protein [Chitinimonas arctica]|uniref:Protein nucleotidyltransferase YdiU n=1 Tax=Chitinimonas arctica TaxID=2594795 RepID=A0A516SDL0_9NEIS|nr:YdiU family protein [Chitinimonas arctica]QDQ26118.1 YdiU family protein [Chitinimonas arctica]